MDLLISSPWKCARDGRDATQQDRVEIVAQVLAEAGAIVVSAFVWNHPTHNIFTQATAHLTVDHPGVRAPGVLTTERRGTYIYYGLSPDFAHRWAGIGASLAGIVPLA